MSRKLKRKNAQESEKKWLWIAAILFVSAIGYYSLISKPIPPQKTANESKVNTDWAKNAGKRYYETHKDLFSDLTPENSEKYMVLCMKTLAKEDECEGIIDKKYWIGMSKDWAKASLGTPNDINETGTANGTREQWIYGDPISGATYLYFENGILTSFQE